MAEVVLFHHALGRTAGVEAFAGRLRDGHHTVHVPDLFDGRTFDDVALGVAHAETLGIRELLRRAADAVDPLPAEVVYAGFSLGVPPAQMLAQTRAGARGAVLLHACVPPSTFGPWPAGLPGQVHVTENDPLAVEDGDLDAARDLAASQEGVEVFLYPGDRHLFAEVGADSYDAAATAVMLERVLDLLDRVPG